MCRAMRRGIACVLLMFVGVCRLMYVDVAGRESNY